MAAEILLIVGASILVVAITVVVLVKARVRIDQGQAVIISPPGRVSFTSGLVIPLIQHAEVIDIRRKTIRIARKGKDSLSCRDGIRVDVVADFDVRINQTAEDVLKVATTIGTARASDPEALYELFAAKFTDALATVTKYLDFEQLDEEPRRESECQELLMRLELQEREALARLRDATGHDIHREDLQRRLDDRLRQLIRDEIDA